MEDPYPTTLYPDLDQTIVCDHSKTSESAEQYLPQNSIVGDIYRVRSSASVAAAPQQHPAGQTGRHSGSTLSRSESQATRGQQGGQLAPPTTAETSDGLHKYHVTFYLAFSRVDPGDKEDSELTFLELTASGSGAVSGVRSRPQRGRTDLGL